jgi:hypothetical protein
MGEVAHDRGALGRGVGAVIDRRRFALLGVIAGLDPAIQLSS